MRKFQQCVLLNIELVTDMGKFIVNSGQEPAVQSELFAVKLMREL